MIFLKKTYGELAHVKEPLMLPLMTSADDDYEEEIISPLAEKLVYLLGIDLENESKNDLLLANTQLPSSHEESDNNERTIAENNKVIPVDK